MMPGMQRPNLILILVDDLGWKDTSAYGSTFYETPNIDRLAREGMRFTDAYAASPVCSPTRASIMTGRYPATVGITNYIPGTEKGKLLPAPYLHYLPREVRTVARALKEGGYHTFHVGKWHLGDEPSWPEHHGFDVNVGGCDWGVPKHGYFSPYGNPRLEDGPPGEYLTDRLTSEAIELLERCNDAPFFLHLSHYAVHVPVQAPLHLVEKYTEKARQAGLDAVNPFREGEHFPTEDKRLRRVCRRVLQSDPAYAAMIENLDWNVGRIIATLERLGIASNTFVFFYSDNGGLATAESSPTCNAPLAEGKGWMYEGGVREPLVAWCPGTVAPGTTCAVPVTSPDFYPTMLDIAGLPPEPGQHVDGTSFFPLLRGERKIDREAIFWHYPHYGNQGGTPGSSVRAGPFKLIEFFEDNRLELYNLDNDIGEREDLSADLTATRDKLYAMLRDWRASVNARIPVPNPEYPFYTFDAYSRHEGPLTRPPGEPLSMSISFSAANPQLYTVPLADLLDGFTGRLVFLVVEGDALAGTIEDDGAGTLSFHDTIVESTRMLDALLDAAGLVGVRVRLRTWNSPDDGHGVVKFESC